MPVRCAFLVEGLAKIVWHVGILDTDPDGQVSADFKTTGCYMGLTGTIVVSISFVNRRRP